MRLAVSGTQEVRAPIEQVWAHLLDHEFVAACAPNVESVRAIDDTHFSLVAALGIGSIGLTFALDAELTEIVPLTTLRMQLKGSAPGSAVRAESGATLTSTSADRTTLDWTLSSDVHGTIASVGARMLKGTAKKLTAAFWKKFAARVDS